MNDSRTPSRPRLSRGKKFFFGCVTAGLLLLALEGGLSLAFLLLDFSRLRHYELSKPQPLTLEAVGEYDAELGWVYKPSSSFPDFYGPGKHLTTNSMGLRAHPSPREEQPDSDSYRVICLGDSFTHGYGMGDEFTYPARLEAVNPFVETVNMGTGGYSIGQCWLHYRRLGPSVESNLVILAVITDDINRMRHGLARHHDRVPKFRLVDGAVEVYNVPVPKLGEMPKAPSALHTGFAEFVTQRSGLARITSHFVPDASATARAKSDAEFYELIPVALGVVDEVRRQALAANSDFVLVLFPTRVEMLDPDPNPLHAKLSSEFAGHAASNGYPYLDLRQAWLGSEFVLGAQLYQSADSHFNERACDLAAQFINGWLETAVEGYPKSGDATVTPR